MGAPRKKLHSCKQLRSKLGIGQNENQVVCFVLSPVSPRKFTAVPGSRVQHCLTQNNFKHCGEKQGSITCYHRCLPVIVSTDIQSVCNGARVPINIFNYS